MLPMSINGRSVVGLLDTGATGKVCCLSENIYKRVKGKCTLQETSIKRIIGIGGHLTKVLGKIELPLKIAGICLYQEFIVLPGCNKPEILLGFDFLKSQNANWNFDTGMLSLQSGMTQVKLVSHSDNSTQRVAYIRTIDDITVSGKSECILPVRVAPRKGMGKLEQGIITPALTLPSKYHVTGPKCAVQPVHNLCCYRLLNPYPTDTMIPQNTIIGTYSSVPTDACTSLIHMSPCPDSLIGSLEPECSSQSLLNVHAPEFVPRSNAQICHISVPQTVSKNARSHRVTASVQHHVNRLLHYSDISSSTPTVNTAHATQSTHAQNRLDYIETAKSLNIKFSGGNMSAEQQQDFLALIGQYRDVFAIDDSELGCYKGYQHFIDTGNHPPAKSRFYRTSPEQKKEIERHVQKLLDCGVIERSVSDWLSPVILVRKADSSYRMVVDLRALNRLVRPVYFPLPRNEDVTDALGESKATIFSTLDLAQAFLQTELDPRTKHKTAFITHHGVFEYNRLPYGLSNSPATFNAVMTQVLRDFLYVHVIIYCDDILLFSNNITSHKEQLQKVFDKLREANLKLRPEKCHIAAESVIFLGHVVTKDGLQLNPDKTQAVRTFPVPTNPTQVRSFLGLSQYYKKWVKGYAHIASPLNDLLKKDSKFVWDSKCQEAFDQLKHLLTSAPILSFPDFNKRFYLYCDASTAAISYILGQRDANNHEVVISYGGRALRDSERKWGITELEMLAMVEGIRHYTVYLCDRPFTVITDHAALQFIQKAKLSSSGRLTRWSIFLQQFSYDVQYKKGSLHRNADSLSRCQYKPTTDEPSSWICTLTTQNDCCDISAPDKADALKRYTELNALHHLTSVMSADVTIPSVKDEQMADPRLTMYINYIVHGVFPTASTLDEQTKIVAECNDYIVDDDNGLFITCTIQPKE
jgi:hypothetical protein